MVRAQQEQKYVSNLLLTESDGDLTGKEAITERILSLTFS